MKFFNRWGTTIVPILNLSQLQEMQKSAKVSINENGYAGDQNGNEIQN